MKTSPRPLFFTVTDPIFKTQPVFILGCSAEKAEAWLKKECRVRVQIDPGAAGMMITLRKYPWRIVWSAYHPKTPGGIATLLHELFHLVVRICGDKGIPIVHHFENGECGDEAAAYLFEFFAAECLRRRPRRRVRKAA